MNFTIKKYYRAIIFLIIMLPINLFSADLEVPNMELITWADFDTGVPVLTTWGKVDLRMSGGYKLGGSLTLGFDSADLVYSNTSLDPVTAGTDDIVNYLSNQTYLQFQSAEVTIRELFSTPTELTYFTGATDVLCSGDDFPDIFGSVPVATRYRGYLYFPDNEFDGIHRINGTGFKFYR